jgi:enoyl-CoA hydratase/carnithine racemase
MADALDDAENDPAVRAILFTGKPQIFSAGNDLEEFLQNPPQDGASPTLRFMQSLSGAAKPVVAAVAGDAIGIGATMLLHCDLVYAAEDARLSLPFVRLGLCPEFASSFLLPRVAGYQRAAEKLLLGEAFGADEACQMGFVNRVMAQEELLPYAQQQAAKLAALPAASIRVTKQLMKKNRVTATEQQMVAEIEHFSRMLTAPEAKEAFTAFFEKRKPDFTQFA